ncbi:hypothetical protein LSAT2_031262 [Lamellibrachia satsuma]|nr:hypothetical protein LSAT2_031262 [Lamellibrachia satsuma]
MGTGLCVVTQDGSCNGVKRNRRREETRDGVIGRGKCEGRWEGWGSMIERQGMQFRMNIIENDRSRRIVTDLLIRSVNQSIFDEIDLLEQNISCDEVRGYVRLDLSFEARC